MTRALDTTTLAEAFDGLRAEYDAARESRFRRGRDGVSGVPRSGDYHIRYEASLMRVAELSEDFARNDPIVAQGVRRLVANVVQGGLVPDALTPDEGLNRAIEDHWQSWAEDAESCDLSGERTFSELQEAAVYAMVVPGDCCLLPTTSGALEFMEYQRLRTPTNLRRARPIVHGVELDANRTRTAYYFTRDEIDPLATQIKLADTRRVDARSDGLRQVFHCYRSSRISLTRGISQMAPAADIAGMHSDVQFAKLVQQQVVSCFALIEELPLEFRGDASAKPIGARDTTTRADGTAATQEQIAPGMRITTRPGAKMTGFSPNVPNPEFFPHATLLLTFIAINLDLPLAVLLLEPKGTFSSYRGAIDQARLGFRALQRLLVRKLCVPCYRWKMAQWAAEDTALQSGLERHGEDYFRHQWQTPRWPYIEPLTDASADVFRMRNLLAAPSEVVAERGGQWSRTVQATVDDNALAIETAKRRAAQINAAFPGDADRVTWRELLSLPTPDRVNVSLSRTEASTEPEKQTPGQRPSGQE